MTHPSPSSEDTSAPRSLPPSPSAPSPLFVPPSSPPPPLDLPTTDDGTLPPWSESDAFEPSAPDVGTASGAPSTETSSKGRLSTFRRLARQVVETAGTAAHQLLTRPDTPARAVGLYVPDSDDVKNIGTPLGSLAARHLPEGTGVENPDLTDLLALGAGLFTYAMKQRGLWFSIRDTVKGDVVDEHDEQGDDAFPPTVDEQ